MADERNLVPLLCQAEANLRRRDPSAAPATRGVHEDDAHRIRDESANRVTAQLTWALADCEHVHEPVRLRALAYEGIVEET